MQWTARSADESPWIGRELDGRYRILCLLGEGRMGALFLALHLPLQKLVAIKVVPAELIGNGESVIRQTRAVIANPRFEHPHVARANDCASLPEGGAYFVMQLVYGPGLGAVLARGEPLAWGTVCELGAQIADALAAAEAAGVAHRDLNPDNILLEERDDGSEFVKVLDFGIARAVPAEQIAVSGSEPEPAATWARTVIGTPGYMAPEQAIGATADHRSDLYALGVILWESIAGKALWTGPDIASLMLRQMSEAAPAISQVAPDSARPPELDRLIQRLLERSPAARPAHAADVANMLRCLADHAAFPLADDPASQRQRAPEKRNAGRWLGLLALSCVLALYWGHYRWSRAQPSPALARIESMGPPLLPASTPVTGIAAGSNGRVPSPFSLAPETVPAHSEALAAQPPSEQADVALKRGAHRGVAAAARAARKPRPRGATDDLAQGIGSDPSLNAPAASQVRPEEPKPKPGTQVRDLTVRGSVSTSVVKRALERIEARLAACYLPNARDLSKPTELEINVAFDERGRASDPRTQGAAPPALRACVTEAAANVVLARPPDTGLAKASWRVTFSPE